MRNWTEDEINFIKNNDKYKTEIIILKLLEQQSMTLDDLVNFLFKEKKIKEKTVKESVLRLREKGLIKPNHRWEMELIR